MMNKNRKHTAMTYKHLIAAMLLGTSPLLADAANSAKKDSSILERDVEIVKEYTPTIKEADKTPCVPELKDSDTKKLTPEYSVWASPVHPGSDSVPPLDYALPTVNSKAENKDGFLKLGGGNHISFLGEGYIPLYKTASDLIDLYGQHNSTFGKVRMSDKLYDGIKNSYRVKGKDCNTFIKADWLHAMQKKELDVYADFGYDNFNYYGFDGALADSLRNRMNRGQAFTNFDAGVRLHSTEFIKSWGYDAQTNYMLFHTKNNINENNILTKIDGKYQTESGIIDVELGMMNSFLSLPDDDIKNGWNYSTADNTDNSTVISILPSYIITAKKAKVSIGAKGFFGIGQGRAASVTPNILGNITISDKYWYMYGAITGDYKVNNYRNMAKENEYISCDVRAEDTYIPIDVYIGSKVNIFDYAMLDINLGYKVMNNPYFFVVDMQDSTATYIREGNHSSNYNIVYGDEDGLFTIGGTVSTNIKERFDLSVSGKFNKWALSKGETAWMTPKSELSVNASYLLNDYFRVKATFDYKGGRKALVGDEEVKMKNITDLSIGATYKVMSCINVFLDLNNLLNKQYETYYGYASQGFNLMAGLSMTF